jgi:hypothetical protein
VKEKLITKLRKAEKRSQKFFVSKLKNLEILIQVNKFAFLLKKNAF